MRTVTHISAYVRRAAAIMAAVACVWLCACGGKGVAAGDVPESGAPEVRELIADAAFAYGCALAPVSTETVTAGGGFAATNVDTLRFGSGAAAPAWQMCQWWSRHDLAGTRPAGRTAPSPSSVSVVTPKPTALWCWV